MKLYLVRHGHNTGDVLSETGKDQAKRLSVYLADKKIDVLYVSPLSRALQTAAILSKKVPTIDKRLAEIDLLGENYPAFSKRVIQMVGEMEKVHTKNVVLVVAHAGVTREILRHYLHLSDDIFVEQDYGSVSVLSIDKEIIVHGVNICV